MKIVLVRHGYSVGNKKNTLSGWADVPLTEEGIEELLLFRNTKDYGETDLYFASDLIRAVHTAKILFPNKKVEQKPDFREINFGIYENSSPRELNFKEFFDNWFDDMPIKNGETYSAFMDRIIHSFIILNRQISSVNINSYTLVCHSGVIRAILSYLENKGPSEFFRYSVPNGCGYKLTLDKTKKGYALVDLRVI